MFKFQFLAQFPMDHLPHPFVSTLALFLSYLATFAYYVINCLVYSYHYMNKPARVLHIYVHTQDFYFILFFASLSTVSKGSFEFALIRSFSYFDSQPLGFLLVKSHMNRWNSWYCICLPWDQIISIFLSWSMILYGILMTRLI